MFCSNCGRQSDGSESFCASCGSSLLKPANSSTSIASNLSSTETKKDPIGLTLSGLIVGAIAVLIALFDYSLLSAGDYSYIEDAEVGLLFILSATALGLAIGGTVKGQRLKTAALTVSIIAMLLTLSLTSYMLP